MDCGVCEKFKITLGHLSPRLPGDKPPCPTCVKTKRRDIFDDDRVMRVIHLVLLGARETDRIVEEDSFIAFAFAIAKASAQGTIEKMAREKVPLKR